MTNKEIDIRLQTLAAYLPELHQLRMSQGNDRIAVELELLNMQMMALTAMLGEIAKRLPEKKNDE